jgi:hypothetical protein
VKEASETRGWGCINLREVGGFTFFQAHLILKYFLITFRKENGAYGFPK